MIARSILLTTGPILNSIKLPSTNNGSPVSAEAPLRTMTEHERAHILATLERCNWKIHGQGGAAELLDLHPSTLNSRMKKMGIGKRYSGNGDK